MKEKIILIIIIFGIVCSIISLNIYFYLLIHEEKVEVKPLKIEQKNCYMPRDCFDTQKDYLEQFPGEEIPDILYECLIYCYKKNINSDLYPIKIGG